MISFIIPFCTIEKSSTLKLDEKRNQVDSAFEQTNSQLIADATDKVIKNIGKNCNQEHEIIIVDNSNTFSWYLNQEDYKNLRVIKGLQTAYEKDILNNDIIKSHSQGQVVSSMIGNLTMWVSLAFHQGIKEAKGDYIVLQHNDVYYHTDMFDMLIEDLNRYSYISVDNKKVWVSTYVNWYENKHFSKYMNTIDGASTFKRAKLSPDDGGYVKTDFGFADAYFFICKKEFFDDYDVDWKYGDTNHGATIKCLDKGLKYKHLGPYYDNPNFDTPGGLHTYQYGSVDFCTHLKGGISECKMTDLMFQEEIDEWLANL